MIMVMVVVNIFEAKAKLSEYLDMATRGERVLICKRNRPVAEIHPVASVRTAPRPVGLGRGRLVVPPSFFEPLPEAMLGAFEGIVPLPGSAVRYDERPEGAGALQAAEAPPAAGCGVRSRRGKRS